MKFCIPELMSFSLFVPLCISSWVAHLELDHVLGIALPGRCLHRVKTRTKAIGLRLRSFRPGQLEFGGPVKSSSGDCTTTCLCFVLIGCVRSVVSYSSVFVVCSTVKQEEMHDQHLSQSIISVTFSCGLVPEEDLLCSDLQLHFATVMSGNCLWCIMYLTHQQHSKYLGVRTSRPNGEPLCVVWLVVHLWPTNEPQSTMLVAPIAS